MAKKEAYRVPGFNQTRDLVRKHKRRGLPIPKNLEDKWKRLLSEQASFHHKQRFSNALAQGTKLNARQVQIMKKADYSPRMQRHIDAFYASAEWRYVRYDVLAEQGAKCGLCNATREDGVKMHVDHIKPLRTYWSLRLDKANLQVLCEICNHGKGARHEHDWRPSRVLTDETEELSSSDLDDAFKAMYGYEKPPII